MGNKYAKKVQRLKERREGHEERKEKHGSTIDIRNINQQSIKKQKKDLKNIKKKIQKSEDIW